MTTAETFEQLNEKLAKKPPTADIGDCVYLVQSYNSITKAQANQIKKTINNQYKSPSFSDISNMIADQFVEIAKSEGLHTREDGTQDNEILSLIKKSWKKRPIAYDSNEPRPEKA